MFAHTNKLYNYSAEYLAAARFYEYHQHSPTTVALTPPYEPKYNFVPVNTNSPPKVFDDFDKYGRVFSTLSSSPFDLQFRAMQLPLTPPLSNTPPLACVSPPRSTRLWPCFDVYDEVSDILHPHKDMQRTHSVIMKVEDQRIVEVPAMEFNHLCSSESEDEIIVCKWRKCYR